MKLWLVCSLPALALGCTTYEYFSSPAGAAATTPVSDADASTGFPDAGSPPACPPGQWCSVDPALTPADLVGGWASPTEALTWVVSVLGSIYRFDGASWSTAYVPDHEVTASSLWATSKDDAWVSVIDGHAEVGAPVASRFVHWDGTSWSMGNGSLPVLVRVVWASAPDDAWAAGYTTSGGTPTDAILHFDGASWTSVPVPAFPPPRSLAGSDSELVDLHGSSRTDAWVMSRTGNLAHWDGTTWTLADLGPATPAATDIVSGLGIWDNAPNDVWLARRRAPAEAATQVVEFVHYDGTGWLAPVLPEGAEGCTDIGNGSTYPPGTTGTLGRGIAGQAGVLLVGDLFDTCLWTYSLGTWTGEAFEAGGSPFRTFALGTEGDSFGLGAAGALGPMDPDGFASAANEPTADDAFVGWNEKVSATGANDSWALGPDPSLPVPFVPRVGDSAGLAAILHWDGTRLSTSAPLGEVGALSGLVAVSPTNVWAVGCRFVQDATDPGKSPGAVSLHFDGTAWQESLVASGPKPCFNPVLSDVWAQGAEAFAAGADGLIVHWDGTAWQTIEGPTVAGESLTTVTGSSPDDVFFVGTALPGQLSEPAVLHWDGETLAPIAVPAEGLGGNAIAAFADAPSSLWVAINWSAADSPDYEVLGHWDGTSWTTATVPPSIYVTSIAGKSGQLVVAGILATTLEQDIEGNPLDAGALFTFDGTTWTPQPLLADITGITSATVKDGALWVVGDHGLFAQQTLGTAPTH